MLGAMIRSQAVHISLHRGFNWHHIQPTKPAEILNSVTGARLRPSTVLVLNLKMGSSRAKSIYTGVDKKRDPPPMLFRPPFRGFTQDIETRLLAVAVPNVSYIRSFGR